jgi:hypothetical protein
MDGKLHGKGKLRWPDGITYDGTFKNGLKDGTGVYTLADGSVYSGRFRKGVRDGEGVMTYAVDGSSLNYTYKAGERYSGGWRDDKRHGACTYTFFNGETARFTWAEDVCLEFNARQSAILTACNKEGLAGAAQACALSHCVFVDFSDARLRQGDGVAELQRSGDSRSADVAGSRCCVM